MFKVQLVNYEISLVSFSITYIWLVIKIKGTFLILVGYKIYPFLHLANFIVSSVYNLIRTDTVTKRIKKE